MKSIKSIFEELDYSYLVETYRQITADEERNDGVILSENQRNLSKKISEINHQPASINLFTTQILVYKELLKRLM